MRAARLVAAALLLAACQQEPVSPPVLKITEHAEAPNPNAGLSSERFIGDGARVEVTGYPDRPRFYTLARTPAIEKYPCATCHTMPLERMRNAAGRPARAHWDVTLDHAPPAVMSCATCHTPDAPDRLRTLEHRPVDFDHGYQVCAQCHGRQASDWAAGAHGKRVGGWAPPRVVYACAQCHNPHHPRWDTRWPAVGRRPE
ncbi:MAG TPA: cytochrome C [Methylomirabilota bacterium]|nr:cytochrome C [Methylomirabilota bacterium]